MAAADLAAPAWLDDIASEAWTRLRPDLPWLTVVDLETFAAWCSAYSRWRQAELQLAEDGMTIFTESGLKASPYVGIALKYQGMMRAFGAELGLTPAARSRIHTETPAPAEKKAERFFGT